MLPNADGGKDWDVHNYSDAEALGQTTLVEATVHSINTVFAQLMLAGRPQGRDGGRHQLRHPQPPQGACPSAVLGTNEVTPIDMASAYSTFANRGLAVPPVLVTRITRADGTVLYAQEHTQKRVLTADVADTLTAILQQVVQRGTATAAILDRPAAGKTGTADDHHDAWFVGYTPQLTTAVWVGFNKGQIPMEPPRTPIAVTGGTYPAQIWQRYMTAALAGQPVDGRSTPPPADAFGPPDPNATTSTTATVADGPGALRPDRRCLRPERPRPLHRRRLPDPDDQREPGHHRHHPTPRPDRRRARRDRASRSGPPPASASRAPASRSPSARPPGSFRDGTVVSQSPPGGSLATQGSTVTIGVVGGG